MIIAKFRLLEVYVFYLFIYLKLKTYPGVFIETWLKELWAQTSNSES